jgi:gamma-glutamylcyclotransferase (GGCT)/AIG2-like uncharacterized protein YtfP
MVQFLFVYGTLKSDFENRHARLLRSESVLVDRGRVRGRLYELGRYPALRLAPGHEDWVLGEVYRLRSPERVLPILDAYEGRQYRRVKLPCLLASGSRVPVWVYLYGRALAEWRRIGSEWRG